MAEDKRRDPVRFALEGLKVIGSIAVIGWAARSAVQDVRDEARKAVAEVKVAVHESQLQQARADERIAGLGFRTGLLEDWRKGLELELARYGLGAVLVDDKRRRVVRPEE